MNAIPSIEDMLKNFGDGGWEALSAVTDRGAKDKSSREIKQAALAADVLWVARSEQGRRVLEFILDNSIRRASWHGDLRFTVEQVAAYGLFREGQNSIAAMLLAALRHATGGDVSFLTTTNPEPSNVRRLDRCRFAARRFWNACRARFRR